MASLLLLPSALLALGSPAYAADHTTPDGAGYSGPTAVVFGSTIRVEGTGWKHPDGSGSGVVAKLDAAPGNPGVQTNRVVADPVNGGSFADKTVQGAVLANASGDWRIDIPFPSLLNSSTDWLPGETHLVRLLSGGLRSGDTPRSVVVEFSVSEPSNTCADTNATVEIGSPTAELGGKVRLTGTGWCHPSEGASRIAIKLDQGAHSRVAGILGDNATIWAIIDPDPATGSFDTEITLPDGTLATSRDEAGKAFGEGGHWLNLLTGSLKPGDVGRSLRVDFTVGAYSPSGAPTPLGDDELTAATKGGVEVVRSATSLAVTVPGTVRGDWVHLDVYSSGAPRALWGGTKWFRVGAGGVVTAPLAGITLPVGSNKLTVQSGNQGEVGRLLGWAPLVVTATGSSGSGTGSTGSSGGSSGSGGTTSSGFTPVAAGVPAPAAATAPPTTPAAPVASMEELHSDNAGEVSSVLEGTELLITVPGGGLGEWVHVRLYDAAGDVALGWAQLDASGQFRVDVSALGTARFKLALQGADGALIGWTGAGADTPTAAVPAGASGAPAASPRVSDEGIGATTLLNFGLSGVGVLSLLGTAAALGAGRPSRKVAP
ncbi:hypothetical protein ASE01_08960 [Nocardioides sp. Root190]|uniref:hypothetical protein n=1 Tax=Nocardioides sp. Root190 TaxID=1736488 RepID=UPI0006F8B90B|nr:hypothetical protein [Nocardioides sp. Root190]KRB76889.1 hypothetical protein ASE01_08960 [Nocardioides sp. Root190]